MKLPFVTRKKYEKMKKNYEIESEARREIRKKFIEFQEKTKEKDERRNESYSQMDDNCKELCNRLEFYELELEDKKKEIRTLKGLLTKNGIKYKKKEN